MKKISLIIISSLLFLQNGIAKKTLDEIWQSEIIVIAHRGAYNNFPENSISSIREVIAIGVDLIEIDIRHTKDNHLVLMHDKTIDRTTNGKGLVENYTLQEIKNFRLKNADGSLSDEQIPTLEEIFDLFGDAAYFDLDIKTPLFMDVVEMVEKYNLLESSLFFVYDLKRAKALKRKNHLCRIIMGAHDEKSIQSIYKAFKPEAIHIDTPFNTVSVNTFIKDNGSRPFINSLGPIDVEAVHNPDAFEKAYGNGANMIQTNYPELLLKHLRSKNLHR